MRRREGLADMPVFNPDAAERHWREMLQLFGGTLKEPSLH